MQERLKREYDLSLILSAPSVRYLFRTKDGEELVVDNPSYYPDPSVIESAHAEPYIKASILVPGTLRRPGDGALPRTPRWRHPTTTTSRWDGSS